MANLIRRLVSKQRKRFKDDEFDLDLSYVDHDIITMSWPGNGAEGFYRNHVKDVVAMLRKYHAGRYCVFNLCSERTYDPLLFEGCQVTTYPFDDHQVPPIGQLIEFTREARAFLEEDEDNVVVIHCKAGKGRTGICAAALMLALGRVRHWSDALDEFATNRTINGRGVTIASQRRWVRYFDAIKGDLDGAPASAPLVLRSIHLHNLPAALARRVVIVITQREEPPPHDTAVLYGLPRPHAQQQERLVAAPMAFVPRGASVAPGQTLWAASFSCIAPPQVKQAPLSTRRQSSAILRGGAFAEAQQEAARRKVMDAEERGASNAWPQDGWRLVQGPGSQVQLILEAANRRSAEKWLFDGSFKIHVYLDRVHRANSLFWAWLHTGFLEGGTVELKRADLDKVDKRVPANAAMTLTWQRLLQADPRAAAELGASACSCSPWCDEDTGLLGSRVIAARAHPERVLQRSITDPGSIFTTVGIINALGGGDSDDAIAFRHSAAFVPDLRRMARVSSDASGLSRAATADAVAPSGLPRSTVTTAAATVCGAVPPLRSVPATPQPPHTELVKLLDDGWMSSFGATETRTYSAPVMLPMTASTTRASTSDSGYLEQPPSAMLPRCHNTYGGEVESCFMDHWSFGDGAACRSPPFSPATSQSTNPPPEPRRDVCCKQDGANQAASHGRDTAAPVVPHFGRGSAFQNGSASDALGASTWGAAWQSDAEADSRSSATLVRRAHSSGAPASPVGRDQGAAGQHRPARPRGGGLHLTGSGSWSSRRRSEGRLGGQLPWLPYYRLSTELIKCVEWSGEASNASLLEENKTQAQLDTFARWG